jgi:hypothetical protein
MIELLIALLYIVWGIALFKIDIDYDVSGILYAGCFENKGFELFFIFYIIMSPIIVVITIYNQFKKLFRFLCR